MNSKLSKTIKFSILLPVLGLYSAFCLAKTNLLIQTHQPIVETSFRGNRAPASNPDRVVKKQIVVFHPRIEFSGTRQISSEKTISNGFTGKIQTYQPKLYSALENVEPKIRYNQTLYEQKLQARHNRDQKRFLSSLESNTVLIAKKKKQQQDAPVLMVPLKKAEPILVQKPLPRKNTANSPKIQPQFIEQKEGLHLLSEQLEADSPKIEPIPLQPLQQKPVGRNVASKGNLLDELIEKGEADSVQISPLQKNAQNVGLPFKKRKPQNLHDLINTPNGMNEPWYEAPNEEEMPTSDDQD